MSPSRTADATAPGGAARPAVVMLLTRDPYRERSGRAAMLRQRIEQFSSRFDVTVAVVGPAAAEASAETFARLPMAGPASILLNAFRWPRRPLQTWLCYTRAARLGLERLVASTGAAAVYIDMIRLAPLCERLPRGVARLLDYDDLLSARYARANAQAARAYAVMGFLGAAAPRLSRLANRLSRPLLALEARRCARDELSLLGQVDMAIFTSGREAATLRRAAPPGPSARIFAAPPMVRAVGAAAGAPPGRRILFLGDLRYGENIQMLRAMAAALARLEADGAAPADLVIDVVGEHAPDLPATIAAARLRFLGRIEDLSSLAGAGVFVAPVTSGSGVKLKILDGMALGCPVVTTPIGLEGLQARANRDLLVVAGPLEVLRAAIALRDREDLKARLAKRAAAYLARCHSGHVADEMLAYAAALTGAPSSSPARARTRATQSS